MNNKRLGTAWEREFCQILAKHGWWVHFIAPAATGGQPFDVIAAKDGVPMAFDCKTSATKRFSINRLEQNQIMAFEHWLRCGNEEPKIAVKYNNALYLIGYQHLKKVEVIDLENETPMCAL